MTAATPAPGNPAIQEAAQVLRARLQGKLEENKVIAPFTSFRLGGPAALYVDPAGEQDLEAVSGAMSEFGLECLVIGKGTNVLVSDAGYPGVVLRLGREFEWIKGDPPRISAGGAAPLPQVANWAARRSLGGMEFAIAIPASVGGAVRMNAGAHGCSVSDVIESARVFYLQQGRSETLSKNLLEMIYRDTRLGPNDVVCSATFALEADAPEDITDRMRRYRSHRVETQPSDAPNAGSMFKNPPGDSAGKLIEAAGLKDHRVGGALVSSKHANFIVVQPEATAQDVFDLMGQVQRTVNERFGIRLFPEVRIVGEFQRSEALSRG